MYQNALRAMQLLESVRQFIGWLFGNFITQLTRSEMASWKPPSFKMDERVRCCKKHDKPTKQPTKGQTRLFQRARLKNYNLNGSLCRAEDANCKASHGLRLVLRLHLCLPDFQSSQALFKSTKFTWLTMTSPSGILVSPDKARLSEKPLVLCAYLYAMAYARQHRPPALLQSTSEINILKESSTRCPQIH